MATKMDVEDSKKRNRSEASISETDGSLLDDSKDNGNINQSITKEEAVSEKSENSDKINSQHKVATQTEIPSSKTKTKESARLKKKANVTGDRFTINRTRVGNSQFYSRKKEV